MRTGTFEERNLKVLARGVDGDVAARTYGGTMVADGRTGLSELLQRHGARDLADALHDGSRIADDFDRQRHALSRAVASATAAGDRGPLLAAMRARLEADDDVGRTLRALLQHEPARLSTPAPPPPPAPVAPSTSADGAYAARLTTPVEVPRTVTSPRVGDELVWAVVGLAAVGVLVVLAAPLTTTLALAPLLFVGQVVLLGLDRRTLRQAGLRSTPAWGWLLVAPGYCYRRGRTLGHAPRYAYALVAVGVVGRLAVGALGVGGGPMIDTGRLEDELNRVVEQSWEVEATTDCPRFVEADPGDEFSCTASMADGGRYTVTFEIEDERGTLREARTSYSNVPAA